MKPKEKPLSWDEEKTVEVPPYFSGKIVQLFDRIRVKVPFKKMKKVPEGEEIVLSDETIAMAENESKNKGCFLCKFILEDYAKNGKLTGHPNDIFEKGTFPVEAKIRHIEITKYCLPEKVAGEAKPPQPEEEGAE